MYSEGTGFVKKAEVQEKILEKDQLRLEQLAAREEQDRGLFGWIGR